VQFDDSDRADESQVEDRRGMRFPGGRVGAGVGGLGLVGGAIHLALQLLASGGSQTAGEIGRIIAQSQRRVQVDPETEGSRLPAGPSGSCRGVDSKNDPAKFIVCVESNVQAFWHRELSGRGSGYHPLLNVALKASLEIISLTRSRGAAIAIAGARADCLSEATAIGALSALLGNALHLRRASPHSTEGGAAFETDQAIVAVTVLAAPISAVSFSTTTEDEQHESNGQGNNTTPTITLAVHYSPFLSPKWKLLSTGQAQRQTSTRYTGSIATDKRTVHCEQQPRHT